MYSVSFTAELLFCSHYTATCFDLSCHHQAIHMLLTSHTDYYTVQSFNILVTDHYVLPITMHRNTI
jgi:hypothetical protein